MWFFSRIEVITLIVTTLSPAIFCECRQSYMTICDNLGDIFNIKDEATREWTDLIVGSERFEDFARLSSFDLGSLKSYIKANLTKLKTLIINHQISDLLVHRDSPNCVIPLGELKTVIFFGNRIKRIKLQHHFPFTKIETLSLVNNKIQTIGEGVFEVHEIKNFDVSSNLLKRIKKGTVPSRSVTKVIKIRHNSVSYIANESFPLSLVTLNLDHNNLTNIANVTAHTLKNLEELTISHNRLTTIPDLCNFTALKLFDVSFNAIKTVAEYPFRANLQLEVLDLSFNKIKKATILSNLVYAPGRPPYCQSCLTISLAFNLLKNISNLDSLPNVKQLVLFGNPWDCDEWNRLGLPLNLSGNSCIDNNLFTGKIPYCVNYSQNKLLNSVSETENDINRFRNVVKTNLISIGCSVSLKKHYPAPIQTRSLCQFYEY